MTDIQKYPAYKDSGVEWLGEVPAHWEVKRLKNVCNINQITLPETTTKSLEFEYVDIGSVTFENGIIQTEKFTFKDAPSRARRLAKTGDTIISTVRTYLKAIDFVDEPKSNFVYSTGFAVLSPIKINSKFLSTIVKSDSFTNQVDAYSKGMSYPAINSTDLGRLHILIPPLPEQTRIAAFLDRKTAQIDTAIAQKERLIELLKERRQIIIQNAVTRGLNPNVRMKDSGVEWIGEVPVHWEVKRLKYLFVEVENRTKTGNEELLSLRMGIGLVPHNDVSDIEITDNGLIGYKIVRPGQIVMNRMRASIGLFGISKTDGLVSPDYSVFDAITTINADYYLHLFKTAMMGTVFRLDSKGLGTGSSGFMRLYFQQFGNIKVIVPPLIEQNDICEHIEIVNNKINGAITAKQSEIEKLKELKSVLINSAVTGKIRV